MKTEQGQGCMVDGKKPMSQSIELVNVTWRGKKDPAGVIKDLERQRLSWMI